MNTSVTYKDIEITSKAARACVWVGAVAIILATLPMVLPLHLILRSLGRQGFLHRTTHDEEEYVTWDLSSEAFTRAA